MSDQGRSQSGSITGDIYEQHHLELYRFALRTCRDPEAAEDLVHEAFLRLIVEVEAGRTPDNVRAWLHRVIANLAVSNGRRAAVGRRFAPVLVRRDEPDRPDDIVLDAERRADLASVLATLPLPARTALVLAAAGFNGGEISAAVGRSGVATRTMMSRARRNLRSLLAPEMASA
jgi:RNA polymerase sigma-70 factor (ECF subfamily)